MATDVELNGSDIALNNNGINYVTGINQMAQSLRLMLLTPKGSLDDTDFGLDMSWMVGKYDRNAAISAVTDALKKDKRIIDVSEVIPTINKNKTTVEFKITVNTTLGDISFNSEVNTNALN